MMSKDAVIFQPRPLNALNLLQLPTEKPDGWDSCHGAAKSSDLGFSPVNLADFEVGVFGAATSAI